MRIRFSMAGAALVAASLQGVASHADENVSIVVDPRTGVASIRNDSTAPIALDGYLLRAASSVFSPTAWNSLDEQGVPGWTDGPALGNRLADTNLTGSLTLGVGASVAIGSPYLPQSPTAIGQPEATFDFTYSVEGVGAFTGDVEFSRRNTVVLVVDPVTGEATIENQSQFPVEIDGYLIRSTEGVLSTSGWTPLQTGLGPAGGWRRAAGAANRLAEGNLLGSTLLAANGGSLAIGAPVNASLLADETDLTLEFNVPGVGSIAGGILFAAASVAPLPGDANGDGSVDLLDLDILGSNFGDSPATLAQGDFNGDNVVDLLDLDILGSNFGEMAATASAAAVPEPAGLAVAVGLAAAAVAQRRSLR